MSSIADAVQILRVKGLKVTFHTYAGDVKALDGVELAVRKGEILGLVGESGCGKSVTSLSIVGLLPPNAKVDDGEVLLGETNLLGMSKEGLRKVRLSDIAMVFQDPMTYLNPVLTVGSQIQEVLEQEPDIFVPLMAKSMLEDAQTQEGALPKMKLEEMAATGRAGRKDRRTLARAYVLKMLREVRLPEPERIFKLYPFELSGGMRQRAMIAMALVRRPKLLIADEMTTALDVTVQAQILQLLKELRTEIDASVLLITHDLGVVAEVCDRVAVMYAGNVVEVADAEDLFADPLHPYTQGLLASVPRVDSEVRERPSISGSVPNLIYPPSGCRFHPRCPKAFEKCPQTKPLLIEPKPGHLVACLLFEK
ncbi:MAG TPA: ABC transporter ATP-binding protein [Nitrososphaerales archaeon]|nr:ABC transporter ATP-binding protein [Nitrososphaerales archaeon]